MNAEEHSAIYQARKLLKERLAKVGAETGGVALSNTQIIELIDGFEIALTEKEQEALNTLQAAAKK